MNSALWVKLIQHLVSFISVYFASIALYLSLLSCCDAALWCQTMELHFPFEIRLVLINPLETVIAIGWIHDVKTAAMFHADSYGTVFDHSGCRIQGRACGGSHWSAELWVTSSIPDIV